MIGRRAIVGLSLLSALFFCALAAQGASAAAHTSENTTAFTCVKTVKPETGPFTDAHCDTTGAKGNFEHVLIPAGSTTIEVTNEKTAENTTKSTPATFKGTAAGVELHIICTTVKSTTEDAATKGKSTIENFGTGTSHKVQGTVIIDFEACKVEKPVNCTVKEPIVTKASFMGVDELAPTVKEKEKEVKIGMGVEFTGDGSETFTELTLEGAKCGALAGKALPITGNIIGTGKPGPTAKESGATMVFNNEPEMQNLKFFGGTPVFEGTFTTLMHTTDKTGNPITLTTTT